jgi:hypothetical protein
MVIRELRGVGMQFGGEAPEGWLPIGAAHPQPTPIHEEIMDFEILQELDGYLLAWAARPWPTGEERSPPLVGDNWYASLAEAEQAAEADFGIAPERWVKVES